MDIMYIYICMAIPGSWKMVEFQFRGFKYLKISRDFTAGPFWNWVVKTFHPESYGGYTTSYHTTSYHGDFCRAWDGIYSPTI